jgi:hypothetical protein
MTRRDDEPAKAERNRDAIKELRTELREFPNAGVWWCSMRYGEETTMSHGVASSSDLARAFVTLCRDMDQVHTYGKCDLATSSRWR